MLFCYTESWRRDSVCPVILGGGVDFDSHPFWYSLIDISQHMFRKDGSPCRPRCLRIVRFRATSLTLMCAKSVVGDTQRCVSALDSGILPVESITFARSRAKFSSG